jgi:ABC-type nickel/cobalt efflux system permease component RcnA
MMADLYTAILLGLSFSNIWICALVIFSLQTSHKSTGAGYIIGRFAGIIVFVVLFHIAGNSIKISAFYLDMLSAISVLMFGIYFIYKYSRGQVEEGHYHNLHTKISEICEHNCNTCIISKNPEIHKYCEDCSDKERDCSSEDIQIEPLTREARRLWGKNSYGAQKSGLLFGLFLGLLRGSAMCGRLIILLPLAIKGTLLNSILVGFSFALSSSIYPLAILIFGDYILRLVKHRRAIIIANSLFLILISFHYIRHVINNL